MKLIVPYEEKMLSMINLGIDSTKYHKPGAIVHAYNSTLNDFCSGERLAYL